MASPTHPGTDGAGVCGPGGQREAQDDVGGRSPTSQQNPLPDASMLLSETELTDFSCWGESRLGPSVWAFGMLTATGGSHPFLT